MACGVSGGSPAIVGTSTGMAPYEMSCCDRAPAWSLVRGTSTRQPNNGLDSHHDSLSRCLTTSPTTTRASPTIADASRSTVSSVDTTVYCCVVVPSTVTATGVSARRPCSMRAAATLPMDLPQLSRIRVPLAAASAGQSGSFASGPASMMCTAEVFLSVTGAPAYAGTASTDEIPGTSSKGTLALAHASASCAYAQNSVGSPAKTRTTRRPSFADAR